MAFKSTAENGGIKDPNIAPGRPKGSGNKKKATRRGLRDRELMALLRKFRPHVSDAIGTAVKIMKDDKSSENSRLRAAAFLHDQYHRLLLEVYEGEEQEGDEEAQEVQPQQKGPVFSLRIVGDDEPEADKD